MTGEVLVRLLDEGFLARSEIERRQLDRLFSSGLVKAENRHVPERRLVLGGVVLTEKGRRHAEAHKALGS